MRGEAVVALPVRLELLALRRRLVDAEPEKRLATERDNIATLPMVDQHLTHQRVEAALHRHRPGTIAQRLVGHGVEPEKPLPDGATGIEIRPLLAVQVPIEATPQ